ncbi:putative aldo/keto reductase-like oxidoreductase [Acetoanaerobium pronyense]|uniref:Aldo/keto reductase-like oxidoreductase n=1 Tax=Acetoanaerobium pronyense TaxID=1482736 RepID=A0ABS4KHW3_9FIRM|nr:aldo/keto reductase [Acetoanaerobium pronyense]MBP2026841.1 putative aldo/keto reductase-like oxidoreductase [Acetoanaerobium pronyense]
MSKLGSTGLNIYELGFGGIPIQRISKEESKIVIQNARKKGINFIDTAVMYTVSEEYIGYAIKENTEDFVIATKSMARTYEDMKKDIEASFTKLCRDYIDIYQLHNLGLSDYDKVMGNDGAVKALLEAKREGKIRHIGITSHSSEVLEKAIDEKVFETVQFPFNIVENQGIEMFKKAKSKGIGTIVMKPLAGGAIEDTSLAIRYIMSHDFIDVIIPGMADDKEIEQNINAVSDKNPLSDEEIKQIDKIKKEMGDKFCRRCGYCMPCTVGINIPAQFIVEGYLKRYDLKKWAVDRYESAPVKASDCTNCKACESRCPYGLSISSMMKRTADAFAGAQR